MTRKKLISKRCQNESCLARFKTIYPTKKFCRRNCRVIQNARLMARQFRALRDSQKAADLGEQVQNSETAE
jgi:hypothetical protein